MPTGPGLKPADEAGAEELQRAAMPRGPRCPLWLWVLLLPPLAGALGHRGPAGPREAAEEPGSGRAWPAFRDLRERLRTAGALSKRYWALFSCRVWPETCEQDGEAPAGPLGKTGGRAGGRAGCARTQLLSSLLSWAIVLRTTLQAPEQRPY